jgi:hypothetical protein
MYRMRVVQCSAVPRSTVLHSMVQYEYSTYNSSTRFEVPSSLVSVFGLSRDVSLVSGRGGTGGHTDFQVPKLTRR